MADQLRRPTPYVPISVSFGTGRTGTAIQERFGLEGLGAWAMLLTAAAPNGMVVLRHDQDWQALGVDVPPSFTLAELLSFLGQRKQTRTTRQGRTHYVEITQWERWNHVKRTELARRRKARSRQESERDTDVTEAGQVRDPDTDTEEEIDNPPSPPEGAETITRKELRRYTGCRVARGSHGTSFVHDSLGTDKPPSDWPHERPTESEVLAAKAGLNANGVGNECPLCGPLPSGDDVDDHLRNVHDIEPASYSKEVA